MTDASEKIKVFTDLYDRNFSKVYNYLTYRLGDAAAADDATSRVFERALDRLETFDSTRGPIEAWLFTIARNAVNDHFRAKRWLSWLPLEAFFDRPDRDPKPEDVLLEDDTRQNLRRALERLSVRERELLALKFGADMNNREISKHTKLGESNVGVILHRAVLSLRATLTVKL